MTESVYQDLQTKLHAIYPSTENSWSELWRAYWNDAARGNNGGVPLWGDALVAHFASHGSGAGFLAGLTAFASYLDATGPVISVVAADPDVTTASITWTTNEAATSKVDYGTTTAYGSSTTLDTNLVTSHSVSVTGLTGGTLYHYRVRSKDAQGNETVGSDNTTTTDSADYDLTVLADSPSGYWKLNEPGGTLAQDSSGNGHVGTYSGSYTLNSDMGSGIRGVYVNDAGFVDLFDTAIFSPEAGASGAMTIECWIKPDVVNVQYMNLVTKRNGGSTYEYTFNLKQTNDGDLTAAIHNTTAGTTDTVSSAGAVIAAATLTHVAMTYDKVAQLLKVYKNGVLVGTQNVTAATASDTTSRLIIGDTQNGEGTGYRGSISRVALYPTALTAARLLAHAQAPVTEGTRTLISDTFTDTDNVAGASHVPSPISAGTAWIRDKNNYTIQSNKLGRSNTSDAILSIQPGVNDYTVEFDVITSSTIDVGQQWGCIVRMTSGNVVTGTIVAFQKVNGLYKIASAGENFTTTYASVAAVPTVSTTYHWKIVCLAGAVDFYVDGVLTLQATGTTTAANFVGFYEDHAGGNFTLFDNFKVTVP